MYEEKLWTLPLEEQRATVIKFVNKLVLEFKICLCFRSFPLFQFVKKKGDERFLGL